MDHKTRLDQVLAEMARLKDERDLAESTLRSLLRVFPDQGTVPDDAAASTAEASKAAQRERIAAISAELLELNGEACGLEVMLGTSRELVIRLQSWGPKSRQ